MKDMKFCQKSQTLTVREDEDLHCSRIEHLKTSEDLKKTRSIVNQGNDTHYK